MYHIRMPAPDQAQQDVDQTVAANRLTGNATIRLGVKSQC
jgi:hypothetical protein